ncbi:MAG: cytochrome c3 family protein [Gammaproteobacteria bacterium]
MMKNIVISVVAIGILAWITWYVLSTTSWVPRDTPSAVFSGQVLSAGRIPVENATVHLVPTTAIDMTPITATDVRQAPHAAEAYDEPLEDAIRLRGAAFPVGTTDAKGRFAISDIPDGKFYIHVTPGADDTRHLPGGDKSRKSYRAAKLRNGTMSIAISSRPSAAAHYVGSTACLDCHKKYKSWQKTAHTLAWSVPGKPGPAQDFSRFPDWFKALPSWTETDTYREGTHLELGDYDPEEASGTVKFKLRRVGDERVPIKTLYADVFLWKSKSPGRYYITIDNKLNPHDAHSPAHLPIELVYGGAVHRQRYIVSVPEHLGKRQGFYTVLQYNPDGRDNRLDSTRRVWSDYKFSYWWGKGADHTYGTADDVLQAPPINDNSIQSMCAGCHVTGVERYTDQETDQVLIRGVNDPNGGFNIDDDPQMDEINIGCETCHGPGSEHVDNAGVAEQWEMATVNPALLSAERDNVVCGRCHDRRRGVGNPDVAYVQPLSASGEIMKPGGSRHEMITVYSQHRGPEPGKEVWPDDVHSKDPHQQYSDFLKSGMYRNDRQMVTCADCHNMHGNTPYRRWLLHDPDDPKSQLCQRCHEVPILAHMEQKLNSKMKGLAGTSCLSCHMPGTMVTSGDAGHYGRMIKAPPYNDAQEETRYAYWEGHINSHVFDVPRKTNVGVWGVEPGKAMPIPYTASCGTCHDVSELPHK